MGRTKSLVDWYEYLLTCEATSPFNGEKLTIRKSVLAVDEYDAMAKARESMREDGITEQGEWKEIKIVKQYRLAPVKKVRPTSGRRNKTE